MTTQSLKDVPELSLQRYLREDPGIGILIHANNSLNLHLRPEFAKASLIEGNGENAVALIETFDPLSPFIKRLYTGDMRFSYKRIPAGEVINKIRIRSTLPTTAWGVMQQVSKATGLVFVREDVVDKKINESVTTIEMSNNSLFWHGSIVVEISSFETPIPIETDFSQDNENYDPYSLNSILKVDVLNGLVANTSTKLFTIVRNTKLQGFSKAPAESLESVIYVDVLNGLVATTKPKLYDIIKVTKLDGFDKAQDRPAYMAFNTLDLDGFTYVLPVAAED